MSAAAEPDQTAEFHEVDGTKYLCHAGDHYCPETGDDRALSDGTQQ